MATSAKVRIRYLPGISFLVIGVGVLTLIGWQFDIARLKSIVPNATPMNPVTAITFILSGAWLLTWSRYKNKYKAGGYLIAGIILVIGLLHFISYFFALDNVRLDYLLYADKIRNSNIPNKIAPNTAFLFLLCGTAMFINNSRQKRAIVFKQSLLISGFFLAYVSILGYIYNIQPAYRMGGFTPMALTTGGTFLLLITAIFFSNPGDGLAQSIMSPLSGGNLARKLIPFILIFPPLTGYLRLLGEKRGLFPVEFGVELNTFLFMFVLLVFTVFYATVMNKKELQAKQTQKEISENERRFRTLLFSMKEGVANLDLEGAVVFCNPAFCDITGYSLAELVNRQMIKMLIPTRDRLKFMEWVTRRSSGKDEDYKAQIIKKTGERIWISVKARSMFDYDKKINGALITIGDITDEVVLLQDLNAFTGSAAHDLNAPLSRILAISGLLESYELECEVKELLTCISDTANGMQKLLRDLLDFSRIGSAQLEKVNAPLDPIVKEVYCFFSSNFKGSSHIHPLPEANVNVPAIRQLYSNLISNAIKYSSKSATPKVEIGAYHKNGQPVYYVKDNGVGLHEEQVKKLFTPFKRFHHEFEGNGLGLVIVKRIVEKHGGHIWAESEPGKGLTVNFTLAAEMH